MLPCAKTWRVFCFVVFALIAISASDLSYGQLTPRLVGVRARSSSGDQYAGVRGTGGYVDGSRIRPSAEPSPRQIVSTRPQTSSVATSGRPLGTTRLRDANAESSPDVPSQGIPSQLDSRRSPLDRAVGSAKSVGASTDVVPRPARNLSSLASGDSIRKRQGFLLRENGRYDFIRVLSPEAAEEYARNSSQFCVVTPRRNFLFVPESDLSGQKRDDQSSSSGVAATQGQGRGSGDSRSEVANEKSDFAGQSTAADASNDYVVFTLTGLDSDEILLLKDSVDGHWEDVDLLNASLIAEGLTTLEKRAHYTSRFETLLAVLSRETSGLTDQYMKTEKVYDFLHGRALYSKYDLNCSSVAASLDSGVFNCVSATVLFNCFASRVGLDVAALETTGHAKSRVKYSDSYLDIETTCTKWDRLPDRIRPYAKPREPVAPNVGIDAALASDKSAPKFDLVSFKDSNRESEEGSTSFTLDSSAPLGYSFTRSRRPMREITEVELVATIFYNVGVDYYQSGNFERAVASYIKAIQLAPNNKTILGNLKATLNNWAIEVAMKEKKYAVAIQITDLGRLLDPDYNEFKTNMPIFFHDWIEYLAKDNRWEDVKLVQEEYWKRFPRTEASEKILTPTGKMR